MMDRIELYPEISVPDSIGLAFKTPRPSRLLLEEFPTSGQGVFARLSSLTLTVGPLTHLCHSQNLHRVLTDHIYNRYLCMVFWNLLMEYVEYS